MRDLLVVVPSRGRPANVARLWSAMQKTCTADTTLLLGIDLDDPRMPEYVDVFNQAADERFSLTARLGLHQVVAWINELAPSRTGDYRCIGMIGDDNLPLTPGWDTRIITALETSAFAFGNDLYPYVTPLHCANHVFTRSSVISALGYFGPPEITHMYVDVAWTAWGVATELAYLDDVIIEHLHYTLGKAQPDASYGLTTALIPADLRNWHRYSRGGNLNRDIGRIGGRPFTPESLRQFNRDLNIPEI